MLTISSDESVLESFAFSTLSIFYLSAAGWPGSGDCGPCFAEPPAESPSTRKSSHSTASRLLHGASLLAGKPGAAEARLALHAHPRAVGSMAGLCGEHHLSTMALACLGCSSR